jgi:hypothetical protein
LYYLNFHSAHSILLSKSLYWNRDHGRSLKAIKDFIGGHFSPGISSDALRAITAREIEGRKQDTPEIVQALLPYTVALFARSEVDEGRRTFSQAIDIAVDLDMCQQDFAVLHAKNGVADEESISYHLEKSCE